jgi:hypothetical protein
MIAYEDNDVETQNVLAKPDPLFRSHFLYNSRESKDQTLHSRPEVDIT